MSMALRGGHNLKSKLLKLRISQGFVITFLLFSLLHAFIITKSMASDIEKVYFAGGCFWCMEPVFDNIPGVTETTSGYMGGSKETANYQDVSTGRTAHIETIEVTYNKTEVDYLTLLHAFWRSIDPTDMDGQFADKGPQYRTAIFVSSKEQEEDIKQSLIELESLKKFDDPIVTKILPESEFFPAEEYHQNYYQKNTIHYNAYKIGSGRAGFLNNKWGKSTDN